MFVGDKIRMLRTELRLSRMKVVRLSGLGRETIKEAELGGVVTPRTAERLAPILGCKPEDLMPKKRSAR